MPAPAPLRQKIYWIPMRVDGIDLKLKIVYTYPAPNEPSFGGFELVDFRASGHPEVDWKWIDARTPRILQNLPFE